MNVVKCLLCIFEDDQMIVLPCLLNMLNQFNEISNSEPPEIMNHVASLELISALGDNVITVYLLLNSSSLV